jgi:hypothetical protein
VDLDQLTALFRRLGAGEPEAWARSQVAEGIPQLARFLFLRQAWRTLAREDDTSWIDERITRAKQHPDEPFAGTGHALARLRARGAADEDLVDLVRGMQTAMLFDLCQLLDDPGDLEEDVAVRWALVQIDEDGTVGERLQGLHESVLETDPTGREMRPRAR